MTLVVESPKRVFYVKNNKTIKTALSDPNETYSPEKVLEHYSGVYPSFINAVVQRLPSKDRPTEVAFEIIEALGDKG